MVSGVLKMIEWVLVILWYVFVMTAAIIFFLFMTFMGFCFWTAFVWNEYIKMDDDNLEKEGNLNEKDN